MRCSVRFLFLFFPNTYLLQKLGRLHPFTRNMLFVTGIIPLLISLISLISLDCLVQYLQGREGGGRVFDTDALSCLESLVADQLSQLIQQLRWNPLLRPVFFLPYSRILIRAKDTPEVNIATIVSNLIR